MELLKDLAAPSAPGARTKAFAELAGSTGLVDFDEPNDFSAADVKAKTNWSVEIHIFLSGQMRILVLG